MKLLTQSFNVFQVNSQIFYNIHTSNFYEVFTTEVFRARSLVANYENNLQYMVESSVQMESMNKIKLIRISNILGNLTKRIGTTTLEQIK